MRDPLFGKNVEYQPASASGLQKMRGTVRGVSMGGQRLHLVGVSLWVVGVGWTDEKATADRSVVLGSYDQVIVLGY